MLSFKLNTLNKQLPALYCKIGWFVLSFIFLSVQAFSQTPDNSYTPKYTISSVAVNTAAASPTTGNNTTNGDIKVFAATLIQSVITFPSIPANSNGSNIINPGATSNNTETPITYTSSNLAVAIITASGMIMLIGPGVTTITASQAGNANYSPANPVSVVLTVTEGQLIHFPQFATKLPCDPDFPVGAISSNSTIPLTYTSSNPAIATVSATGIIHIVSAGIVNITVSQAGNNLYIPATPVTNVLTITSVNPVVAITPSFTSGCVGMPITFSAAVSGVAANAVLTYQWQVNGVNVSTNATFTSTTLTSTDAVTCIVTNTSGCNATGTSNSITGLVINPYITPTISIASSSPMPICNGTQIFFTSTAVNAGTNPTYQWRINGTVVSAGNNPQFNINAINNGDVVTCTLINNDSPCLATPVATSNGVTINVIPDANPAPTVTISTANNGAYPGVPITFTATPANVNTGFTYQWEVNGKNAGTNSPTFTSSTLNNDDKVTCMLMLSSGCIPVIVSNVIPVDILPPPFVTVVNTFTPNNDGVNDFWDIPDLAVYPNCLVSIFNRYGTQIFQSRGYSKPWDGTYKGSQLPAGVYYYIIDPGNNTAKLSGWVAIVR